MRAGADLQSAAVTRSMFRWKKRSSGHGRGESRCWNSIRLSHHCPKSIPERAVLSNCGTSEGFLSKKRLRSWRSPGKPCYATGGWLKRGCFGSLGRKEKPQTSDKRESTSRYTG